MKKTIAVVTILSLSFLFILANARNAEALAQWTRKYNMNCQSCHTAFPRLNYFGEQFARNGYQIPDTEDGDETKEKVNDTTFIDKLGNLFGVRVSVSPVEAQTNTLSIDGTPKDYSVGFGDTKWIQLFAGGSIFKNASIFIETEIEGSRNTALPIHFNWYTLGYHNLFGTSLLNLRAGQLSMMNWHSQTGRLRMIPNIDLNAWRFRPSRGTNSASAEESIRIVSPAPAVEVYGYKNFFLYSVGVSNGEDANDSNQYKNFFGTLRLELPDGELAGSSISGWGMYGWDAAFSGNETTPTAQAKNTFYRVSGASNVRWKKFDLIAAYVYGRENNYNLNTTNLKNRVHGLSGQLGYLINPHWFAALQYDYTKDTRNSSEEYHKVSESVSYMPRENMRIGLTLREEMKKRTGGRQHEALLHVRAMF